MSGKFIYIYIYIYKFTRHVSTSDIPIPEARRDINFRDNTHLLGLQAYCATVGI